MMAEPRVLDLLSTAEIDAACIIDMEDYLFGNDSDEALELAHFIEIVLSLQASRTATVLDLTQTRQVIQNFSALSLKAIDRLEMVVFGHDKMARRRVSGRLIDAPLASEDLNLRTFGDRLAKVETAVLEQLDSSERLDAKLKTLESKQDAMLELLKKMTMKD